MEPREPQDVPQPDRQPPPYSTDPTELERLCEVEYVRGSGPGGQHKNKRETGVRLRHVPSGVVLVATERRSREQNLAAAYERLILRLEALNHVPKRRRATGVPKGQRLKRLESKRKRAAIKSMRRRPVDD